MSEFIEKAQWFDFGTITSWSVIDASQDAVPFLENKLFLMPYELCIFRMRLSLLDALENAIKSLGSDHLPPEYERTRKDPNRLFHECLYFIHQDPTSQGLTIAAFTVRGLRCESITLADILTMDQDGGVRSAMHGQKVPGADKHMPKWELRCILAMWLMLNTKHINVKVDVPAEKLNRARAKNGKPPLLPVTRVDGGQYVTALRETRETERSKQGDGQRKSPKMHLRRAHLRHLSDTKIIPIHAMIINAKDGVAPVREQYRRMT